MTGIAGWFFAYLFFMAVELFFRSLISLWFCAGALGAWIGALMGRTAEEQNGAFLPNPYCRLVRQVQSVRF